MRRKVFAQIAAYLALGIFAGTTALAQKAIAFNGNSASAYEVAPRVLEQVDEARRVTLVGNTHPLARPEYEKGLVEPSKMLERVILVLQRSPEQEKELAAFNERQYDPQSPDFHHWLTPTEFGKLYGPSDADIAAVSGWLQSHGMQIYDVGKGRVWIEFTGTVAQVSEAFHVEMHNYSINGEQHISNDRDPSIPAALAPVVEGIASLNDFRPRHQSFRGNYVKRDMKTGKFTTVVLPAKQPSDKAGNSLQAAAKGLNSGSKAPSSGPTPQFGYTDAVTGKQREELTPFDVATIWNILPLWNASTPIDGTGIKVAVIATSDVLQSDVDTFRSSFGLPPMTLQTVHNGKDPGVSEDLGEGENIEDVEMAGSTAPGAQIVLVSSVGTATSNPIVLDAMYIADNDIAPIATGSYGSCELNLGTSTNALLNNTWQQASTAGVSLFESSGDQGSAGCTSQNGTPPYEDTVGLQVNGFASSPYITAVGGTDLQWALVQGKTPYTTYWNTTNDPTTGASAKGYMPEMSWNTTCSNPLLLGYFVQGDGTTPFPSSEAICNAAIDPDPGLVEISSGSGGVSHCTTPTGTTPDTCAGGYAKPSWQTGVTGIPSDGKRDVPDVAMFASYGWGSQQPGSIDNTGIPGTALLICQASNSEGSCDYSDPNEIIYQENGGTSAASPLTAGIMALVLQKIGGAKQGLANPVFYKLAAKEAYSSCNSNSVKAGNSCIFYDTTSGSNAQVCETGDPDCVTNTSGDEVGILSGYSATTGYDLTTGLGSMNVTNLVNAWTTAAAVPTATLTPASVTFPSTTVNATSATTETVTLKNTSTVALTISNIEITGADFTSYNATTTCASPLAAGASCTVTLSFTPLATGTLTASLVISDNTASGSQTTTISGTGATTTTMPVVTLTPATLTFASTVKGATTAAQTVTVKNTGNATLSLTSETITGTDASSFVKSATSCGSTLAANASCTVSVEFKPATTGALTASLSIADNASGTPQLVALKGTATAPSTLTLSLSPASLAFASTNVGSTTAAQTVIVQNTGSATVTLTSGGITFTGTDPSSFVTSAVSCGATLTAGSSCTISVAFKPAAGGALSANLAVADNASGSPQTVKLTGTGVAPNVPLIGLSVTSLTFPATITGTTSDAQVVTVTNSGKATATISSIAMSGTNASSFPQIGTCGTTLAAAGKCSIYVAFKPAAAGALTATLAVTDNSSGSPQKVTLKGTGTAAPSVKLSATTLTFAATTHGTTSAAQTLTLTNSGTATLDLTSITLTGTNPTSFEALNTCGPTLAAAANCMVYVAFKPATTGTLTAKLTIADNGSASPQSVTLTGTGK